LQAGGEKKGKKIWEGVVRVRGGKKEKISGKGRATGVKLSPAPAEKTPDRSVRERRNRRWGQFPNPPAAKKKERGGRLFNSLFLTGRGRCRKKDAILSRR